MGAVFTAKPDGSNWQLQSAPLKASDTAVSDQFGFALAITGDVLVVGAPRKTATGGAYVFHRMDSMWVQDGTALRPTGLSSDDRFGHAVAVGADSVAVGAPGDDAPTSSTNNIVFFYTW